MVSRALQRLRRRRQTARQDRQAAPPSLAVRLPDGRVIAVEEYGDPAGPTVLYFHGWPASRLEAGLIPGLPVRLLAFDRPGYGRSSPHPGRTLLDWPRDVADVADRLGLQRFHVVGVSGGAPFAVACAYALPQRVRGAALVCPVPPAHGVDPHASGVGLLYRLGRHPVLAHRLFSTVRPLLRHRVITPRTLVGGSLPAADRECLDRQTLSGLARVWREGVGRSVQGAAADAGIYARDWQVPLCGITVPVDLWHGGEDSLIPRYALAAFEAIPNLRLHLVPDEGHYSLAIRHAPRILEQLTREPQPAVPAA
jgi:pimeloyl-ACP methyl ester carboxylesterase